MFDDVIESLTLFDPLTGELLHRIPRFTLYAKSHYVTPRATVLRAIEAIKVELRERLAEFHAQGKLLELQRLLKDEKDGGDTPIEMRFAGNQARFQFSGMEFVTKLVEGKFPDYNRVIPRNHRNSVTLGRAPLLACLQRAAILTSEKFKGVRVNIEPGSLRIASSNAEQEEAKEELEVDYGGDAIEIGFNVTYLIDALTNMSQEMIKIELQDTNSSALITVPEQAGFKYVVMPMRI